MNEESFLSPECANDQYAECSLESEDFGTCGCACHQSIATREPGWYWWRATPDSFWEVVLRGGSTFIRVGDNAAYSANIGEWGERIVSPTKTPAQT